MTHETARQRAARHKRDRLRDQVLAPSYDIPPVRCACGHARLMHQHGHSALGETCVNEGRCLSVACRCTEYREQP